MSANYNRARKRSAKRRILLGGYVPPARMLYVSKETVMAFNEKQGKDMPLTKVYKPFRRIQSR